MLFNRRVFFFFSYFYFGRFIIVVKKYWPYIGTCEFFFRILSAVSDLNVTQDDVCVHVRVVNQNVLLNRFVF